MSGHALPKRSRTEGWMIRMRNADIAKLRSLRTNLADQYRSRNWRSSARRGHEQGPPRNPNVEEPSSKTTPKSWQTQSCPAIATEHMIEFSKFSCPKSSRSLRLQTVGNYSKPGANFNRMWSPAASNQGFLRFLRQKWR